MELARSHGVAQELERCLQLHRTPRKDRLVLATLGFVIALAITRGITTF